MRATSRQCLRAALVLIVFRVAAGGQPGHKALRQLDLDGAALLVKAAPGHGSGIITKGLPATTPKPKPEAKTVIFKMPVYRHADSLSALTHGYLDWFVIVYWSVLLLILLGIEGITHVNGGVSFTHLDVDKLEKAPSRLPSSLSPPPSPPPAIVLERSSSMLENLNPLADGGVAKPITLPPNMWTLNVVCALGQATDRKGNILNPMFVFTAGIAMGLLQLFVLFLVVYDIDPSATPYTEKPAAPWKTSPLTVNCMKFVMVFFLGMSVVAEAGDAYDNFIVGVGVDKRDLLTRRFNVLFIPAFHYFITMSVILAGVSVILSCQAVPDILYNSMAIVFITQVDELFWNFISQTFEVEAEWQVMICESQMSEAQLLKKCIVMFPMLWGFCLLGRAWYRDQMPALIVRVIANAT